MGKHKEKAAIKLGRRRKKHEKFPAGCPEGGGKHVHHRPGSQNLRKQN